jgi:hypothetical protein
VYEFKRTGEKQMIGNIFYKQAMPLENPLHLTGVRRETPVNIIRRNIRRDPSVQPGDEIYDRARVIFSRARRPGPSRASSII